MLSIGRLRRRCSHTLSQFRPHQLSPAAALQLPLLQQCLLLIFFYDSPLSGNIGPTSETAVQALRCRALTTATSFSRRVGKESGLPAFKSRLQRLIKAVRSLWDSSMSAEPPPKSTQLLPQLNKRPERQWPLPKDRQRPQTFLYGQSGTRRCRFQC